MKQFIAAITLLFSLASCRQHQRKIVSERFIDSLISHYREPEALQQNRADLGFWKARIDPAHPGLVSELRYASCLVQRFHLQGNIQDLLSADSVLTETDRLYNHKETSPLMALIKNSILQHRFREADSMLAIAKKIDLKPYDDASVSFDVAFERGQYLLAGSELKKITDQNDYGYNFRQAKWMHYEGEPDSSVAAMQRAFESAGKDIALQQAALSNEADLLLHNAAPEKAYPLYQQSLQLSNAAIHSLMGIAWIALVHDENDSLAEKIYRFVQTKTKSPDVIYKMIQVEEKRGNKARQKQYAREFESIVTQAAYGNMYNKYLLELYTGILNEPAKAVMITGRELKNRATPQTYAWYAWALYRKGMAAEAKNVYEQYVSGKPLEGLELYWMGKFMLGQGKGYNAKEYFKAAYKNRYDLGPDIVNDIKLNIGD